MDKFPMKLVIDPVTTPLLHAKLAEARTPRERASLLRSIAEAALRLQFPEPSTHAQQAKNMAATPPASDAGPGTFLLQHAVAPADAHTNLSNEGAGGTFDSAGIADQLSSFF
ncbi:hypothetical protein QYH69_24240 [Paraburkholderia sp. SARCC-3016]|nr:hypothetical protein [Paraburkholderia sp. SARCC-3016]